MSAAGERLLEIENLRARLGGRDVLAARSFALARGECALILGANGSGKTTFLRVLAGFLPPFACDRFWFCGALRRKWKPDSRALYCHQTPYLFLGDALANARYGLSRQGVARAEADARARSALAWAGVENLAARDARRLSGGEARRVALARARAAAPPLFLLDEPTAHLDEAGAAAVRGLVRDLAAEGASAIIATHDEDLAAPATKWRITDGELARA